MSESTLPTNSDGKLSSYSWPGGHLIYYLDSENSILCPKCAEIERNNEVKQHRPIVSDIHWEGEPLVCGECNDEIKSVYGEINDS